MTVFRVLGMLTAASLMAGCAHGPVPPDSINDPFEASNRSIHEFNKIADTAILRPVAMGYGAVVSEPVRDMVNNGANNLALPGQIINLTLQGNLPDALRMSARFFLNSTVGLGGVLDPATDAGLFVKKTNFGETLGVWGIAEGPYVELPLVGGSTVRDTVGLIVDYALDPMQKYIPARDRKYIFVIKSANIVGDRFAYSDLVDALLYESADSYAAQRITYLQNMRRDLAGETTVQDLEDPYAFE